MATAGDSWKHQGLHPGLRGGTCNYTEKPLGVKIPSGLRSESAVWLTLTSFWADAQRPFSTLRDHGLHRNHSFTDGKLNFGEQALVDIWGGGVLEK